MADDLIEELTFEAPSGPHKGPLTATYARDLTEADRASLELPRGQPQRLLQRIHSSHHALAKCLAAGMRPAQAALVTGYSPGRITSLQRDPAFIQLTAEYKAENESVMADLAVRMRGLSHDAIEVLHERLHEKPEDFSTNMLLDIVKALADRTGYGPGANVTHSFSMPTIDRPPREDYDKWIKRRSGELEPAPDIELLEPPTRSSN